MFLVSKLYNEGIQGGVPWNHVRSCSMIEVEDEFNDNIFKSIHLLKSGAS